MDYLYYLLLGSYIFPSAKKKRFLILKASWFGLFFFICKLLKNCRSLLELGMIPLIFCSRSFASTLVKIHSPKPGMRGLGPVALSSIGTAGKPRLRQDYSSGIQSPRLCELFLWNPPEAGGQPGGCSSFLPIRGWRSLVLCSPWCLPCNINSCGTWVLGL